ncbi:hypothetical protein D9M71_582380 [compost metagenome]
MAQAQRHTFERSLLYRVGKLHILLAFAQPCPAEARQLDVVATHITQHTLEPRYTERGKVLVELHLPAALPGVEKLRAQRALGDHQRLGAQVGPEKGVRRVAVGGNDGRVSGGRDLMIVVQLVEGGLELAGLGVHREFVHHGVVHDQRQAVDKAFLGDRLGLLQARRGNALGHIGLVGLCDRIELARAPGEKC